MPLDHSVPLTAWSLSLPSPAVVERQAEQRAHPESSGPPDTVPIPPASLNLSTFPHRASLDEAAHGDHAKQHHSVEKGRTTPDMEGVTHIREAELVQRSQ